jgi:replication factor C subunit 2/4
MSKSNKVSKSKSKVQRLKEDNTDSDETISQVESYKSRKSETGHYMVRSSRNRATRINRYDEDRERLRDSLPWVEKYRPKSIDNISLDRNIKTQIKKMIEDKDVRNIILEGPSGVGKTSTVRCIAREIYGKYYRSKVLEINASDDRGIKIQNPIDIFNRAYVHIEEEDIDRIPNFKLVILDEADNMTDKAKHNITKFIETNKKGVRFAFTCNSKDNISTAIQSRCHIINYPKLDRDFVMSRLKEICEAEGIYGDDTKKSKMNLIDSGIFAISEIADGDLRIAVNTLQLTYDRFGTVDQEKVYGTYDKPHPEQSRDIIWACILLDLPHANRLMMEMIRKGFSVTDITAGLNLSMRQSVCTDIPDIIKIRLIQRINYSQYNVSQGLELSHIQARGCVADMCEAIIELSNADSKLIGTIQKKIRLSKTRIANNGKTKSTKVTKKKKTIPKAKAKAKAKATKKVRVS